MAKRPARKPRALSASPGALRMRKMRARRGIKTPEGEITHRVVNFEIDAVLVEDALRAAGLLIADIDGPAAPRIFNGGCRYVISLFARSRLVQRAIRAADMQTEDSDASRHHARHALVSAGEE